MGEKKNNTIGQSCSSKISYSFQANLFMDHATKPPTGNSEKIANYVL
jgi:hypothetical protein